MPPGGVSGLPDNHFIVGLGDTVGAYETKGAGHGANKQNEKTPLIPGGQANHYAPVSSNYLIRRFGNYGVQSHEFIQASGIAVSPLTDDIFVSDSAQNKISCFSSTGVFRGTFSCDCSVRDIAITKAGTVLAAVSQANKAILREYTVEGRLLASFGSHYSQENPFGVALSRNNLAVVTSLRQNCVHVLTEHRKQSLKFGSRGRGMNHFISPFYVAMTNNDEIIVSDSGNHRIKVHKLDGTLVTSFGMQGSKPGQLFYPMGLCVDKYDNIYVADANNYRVQAFSKTGECIGIPVKNTYEYGIDVKPINVQFSSDNVLIVVLRGSKFCQIHTYMWNTDKFKPVSKSVWDNVFPCCH